MSNDLLSSNNHIHNAVHDISTVLFTINDYIICAIILILILPKLGSRLKKIAFGFSGISLAILILSYMFNDEILIDINNTPRFGLLMMDIGMISTAAYWAYWFATMFKSATLLKKD